MFWFGGERAFVLDPIIVFVITAGVMRQWVWPNQPTVITYYCPERFATTAMVSKDRYMVASAYITRICRRFLIVLLHWLFSEVINITLTASWAGNRSMSFTALSPSLVVINKTSNPCQCWVSWHASTQPAALNRKSLKMITQLCLDTIILCKNTFGKYFVIKNLKTRLFNSRYATNTVKSPFFLGAHVK